MHRCPKRVARLALAYVALLFFPLIARADGGPIIQDSQLWAQLQEGQQIAVIQIENDGSTAHIDLFVTIQDKSGQPHQITYFVPLGVDPTNFKVNEETAGEFDTLTSQIDQTLRADSTQDKMAAYKNAILASLLGGSALINGGWSWPLWLVAALAGCNSAPAPIASYDTPGSHVSVYGLDQTTDLQALISQTGLDPSVQSTLARLKGQQIAVIQLQTKDAVPPTSSSSGSGFSPVPGLHLTWTTKLAPKDSYVYPLGTGSAWATPIAITRVYVIAPPQSDFTVQFPRLGTERSGYFQVGNTLNPVILKYRDEKTYAVNEAVGAFGHYWRVTYTQSNSAEDVTITRTAGLTAETQSKIDLLNYQNHVESFAWLYGIIAALIIWLVTWRYGMPRLLGIRYRWLERRFWIDALRWSIFPLVGVLILAAAVAIVYFSLVTFGYMLPSGLSWIVQVIGIVMGFVGIAVAILVLLTLPGFIGLFLFSLYHAGRPEISRGRAARAYVVIVLIANVLYLIAAGAFAFSVGAL